MKAEDIRWIVGFIWGVADDVLRDVFVRGKYRDVILPMVVIRRLDAVIEPTKQAVLEMSAQLEKQGIEQSDLALCSASKQPFYNSSPFTLADLKNRAKAAQLKADFEAYLDGFSSNVREILEKFRFHNQIPTLVESDRLGPLIEKFLDPSINLSPKPVLNNDGSEKLPALDNHAMGTVFEELIRRFNEENNEEAGEHFTPRDVVALMADLMFLPIADQIKDATYTLYDGACGTGGMLTVAEERLKEIAGKRKKKVSIHLFGQEVSAETYAISRADLLLKGEGEQADHIKYGSTISNDQFIGQSFDFMLSNPPYGKSWKVEQEKLGGKAGMKDQRFIIEHGGDGEFNMITRSSDGQMLFLVNKLHKMKENTTLGSRIAEVHNGSSLFTGDAGQGESNIRRWIIENDWLEAIIALPLNIFYNTGIATYIWVLTNKKATHRKGKVQLIDASQWFKPLRKNLGKKNCELSSEDIERINKVFLDFKETPESKIFENKALGYWKVTVERPLRLHSQITTQAIQALRFASGDEDIREEVYKEFGSKLFNDFGKVKESLAQRLQNWSSGEEAEEGEEEETTKKGLPEKKQKKLLDPRTWERDGHLVEAATGLRKELGDKLYEDHNHFRNLVESTLDRLKIKLSNTDLKQILKVFSWREESAPPVIAKLHKPGKAKPDPLHGLYEATVDGKKLVVEYESDSDLRDTEQIPLLEEGGIEAFFRREVLPYTPDAWLKEGSEKTGYEISFTRHFYKPPQLRTLAEISADILALEKETEGLLSEITKGAQA